MDSFSKWLDALEARHLQALTFQEVRRGVQALSSIYVERRRRLAGATVGKGALDGAGKRAAFALFFGPLHFLLIREIVRALGAERTSMQSLLDLGCGTGVAAAAWASEIAASGGAMPSVTGVDRNSWAAGEARWTYGVWGLSSTTRTLDIQTLRLPLQTAVVAAFTINELSDEARDRWLGALLRTAKGGSPVLPVLIIEPIAARISPWWETWSDAFIAAGGRSDEWRFRVELPERLALLDKAAGLDHRELTGRSLWIGPRDGN